VSLVFIVTLHVPLVLQSKLLPFLSEKLIYYSILLLYTKMYYFVTCDVLVSHYNGLFSIRE